MIIAIDRDHKGTEVRVTLAAARRVSELVAVRSGFWEISRVLDGEGIMPPTGVSRWADAPERLFSTIVDRYAEYEERARSAVSIRAEIRRIENAASHGGPQRYAELHDLDERARLLEERVRVDE